MTDTTLSTEPVVLTYDEAVDLLNRAVAEKGPDYVYPRSLSDGLCVYFEGSAPSCIVGHLLAYKGIDAEQVAVQNENGFDTLIGDDVIGVDRKTECLLNVAQASQDSQMPWGDAVALAMWSAENFRSAWEYHYNGASA